jgi:hypothetical protein
MNVRLSEWKQTEVDAIREVGEKLDRAAMELSAIPGEISKAAEHIAFSLRDESGGIGRLIEALKELSTTSNQLTSTCLHLRYSMRTSLLASLVAQEEIRVCLMVLYWLEAIVSDERLKATDVSRKLKTFEASDLAHVAKDYVQSAGVLPKFEPLFAQVDSDTTNEWRHTRLREIDEFHLEILVPHSGPPASPGRVRPKTPRQG